MASHDLEEQELRLIHRNARIFAIGHGCSPEWQESGGSVTTVRSEVMPSHVVAPRGRPKAIPCRPATSPGSPTDRYQPKELVKQLDVFIEPYQAWIDKVVVQAAGLEERHPRLRTVYVARLERARERMRDGVRCSPNIRSAPD